MKANTKKIIASVILVCVIVSALSHWKDIKHGAIDGWNDGAAIAVGK